MATSPSPLLHIHLSLTEREAEKLVAVWPDAYPAIQAARHELLERRCGIVWEAGRGRRYPMELFALMAIQALLWYGILPAGPFEIEMTCDEMWVWWK